MIDDLDDTAAAIDYLSLSLSDEVSVALLLQAPVGAPLLRKQTEKTLKLIQRLLDTRHIDLGLFIPLFFDVEDGSQTSLTKSSITQSSLTQLSQPVPTPPLAPTPLTVSSPSSRQTRFSLDLNPRDASLRINRDLEERLLTLLTEALDKAAKDPDSGPPVSLQVAATALELLFRKGRELRKRIPQLLNFEDGSDKTAVEKQILSIDQEVEAILRHHVKVGSLQ